jgi:hypothetical protein
MSDTQLRKIDDGLRIQDVILYKFLYTAINSTKEDITSSINNYNLENNINNKTFSRRSFESKERNIGDSFYSSLLNKIIDFYNINCNSRKLNEKVCLAIDGTNNNDNKYNVMLNMGYFDIDEKVPIDLTNNGAKNRNKEVQMAMEKIEHNPTKFNNTIIIGDRLYFTYKFMNFLDSNNIKFIIRAKGDGDNLNKNVELKKNIQQYELINNLRSKIRVVKCEKTYDKIVSSIKSKKFPNKTYYLTVKNNCVLITNLMDNVVYNDEKLLELYRKRWEIETFFKFIKKNFKVQFMKEKDNSQYQRLLNCELILIYIMKIIKYYYFKNKEDNNKHQINESLLINGIIKELLFSIINGNLKESQLNNFCKSYIRIIKNEDDRHFPRVSNRPFSKWSLKCYSASSRYIKILVAIENKTVNELDKNLKIIANRITIIKIEEK